MCFLFSKTFSLTKQIDTASVNCESEILVCSEARRIFKIEEEKF